MAPPAPSGEDELYGLPLEEFTAARNALAKELARQGDRAAAAEVKRLPKPSRTAWALNQLARRHPEQVQSLVEAGERLRGAQEQALAGDASQLRAATRAEQEQVDALARAALEILGTSDGATHDRLRRTLRAAAVDPDTGDLLRRGRLVGDVEPSGFGLEGFAVTARREAPVPAPKDEATREAQEQEQVRREELREAKRAAERLRREAEAAQHRVQRLIDEAERAQQRAHETRLAAEDAVQAATRAERLADEAAARVQQLTGR